MNVIVHYFCGCTVFVTYKHGKDIAVLNKATYQDDVMRSGVTSLHFLNFSIGCT